MICTFEKTYGSIVQPHLTGLQGVGRAYSSRAHNIGSCANTKDQTRALLAAGRPSRGGAKPSQAKRLMVAYCIDVGVAQVVDDVGEKLDQPVPKCRLLLMRQYVDPCGGLRFESYGLDNCGSRS